MKKDINIGDEVLISTSKEEIKGILLESNEPNLMLIKTKSGYNVGLTKEEVINVELIKKKEEKSEKEMKFQEKKNLPYIDIIMTGGTISSRVDYKTGANSWLTKPEQLFKFYPEIFEVANIRKVKIPFMKASENMSWNDWGNIAKEVEESLNNKDVKGVIITHGTDFLHYTSAVLSFFLRNLNKPVVLTYAQRSSDRASSDASLNLLCSAHLAVSDIAEIMLVGHASINDDYCYAYRGSKVRKMHSSRRDAFKPINIKPIAKINADGKIEGLSNHNIRDNNKKVKIDFLFSNNVVLIKYFPGAKADILEYLTKNYQGVIIEGGALGHVAVGEDAQENWFPAIKRAILNGATICMTSQAIYGKVDQYVYSPARELDKAGVIYLKDMLSETAYIKLSWVLGHKEWKDKIKDKMLENISGEYNERIEE